MGKADLKLDWCSAEAARYAVMNWHYSRRMPVFKVVRIGIWEEGVFVGAVIFGCGGTPEIANPFGLRQTEVCELVRVALCNQHRTPVSKIIAVSLRMLRQQSPGLRLVVSFADSAQGHHGGIYQAGGWFYIGSMTHHVYRVNGVDIHPKTLHSRYGVGGQSIPWLRNNIDPLASRVTTPPKHKYVMPLDDAMREQIAPLAKPYPKRAGSADGGTAGHQPVGGGSIPTPALSLSEVC